MWFAKDELLVHKNGHSISENLTGTLVLWEKWTFTFLKNGHWTLAFLKNGQWTLDPPPSRALVIETRVFSHQLEQFSSVSSLIRGGVFGAILILETFPLCVYTQRAKRPRAPPSRHHLVEFPVCAWLFWGTYGLGNQNFTQPMATRSDCCVKHFSRSMQLRTPVSGPCAWQEVFSLLWIHLFILNSTDSTLQCYSVGYYVVSRTLSGRI